MVKVFLLAKANKDKSRDEFINHYEGYHIQLGNKLYPLLRETKRQRNYIDHGSGAALLGLASKVGYDVVSEVVWPDQELFERRLATVPSPEQLEALHNDEALLFERGSMRLFIADEYTSRRDSVVEVDDSMVKVILLAKRKKGMSRQAFIDYYENKHIPFADTLYPGATSCIRKRNYIDHNRVLMPSGFSGELEYDVITEVVWPTRAMYEKRLEYNVDSKLAQQLRDDEENLFDKESMALFFVDVHDGVGE